MLQDKPDMEGAQKVPDLDRTRFFADIIGELSGLLESVTGLKEAEGFISTVGTKLGRSISDGYPTDPAASDPDFLAGILVDLKARINGDFSIVSADKDKIILSNTRCPFGTRVNGRRSLCMMTANVFGRIVADRNGYAHIEIEEAIASGHAGCRVVVSLNLETAPPDSGLEFFER
ncbi:methanogen output domain 1-containing protein [Loktanella agnita]|uniref:methanogen output domain 1-containing protein n=1 Tax=Loktanella agnita TaxID=287097 RepID=UPI003988C023